MSTTFQICHFMTDIRYDEDTDSFEFTGDGVGDFEQYSDSVSEGCLEGYIESTERKLQWAKNSLERMKLNKSHQGEG